MKFFNGYYTLHTLQRMTFLDNHFGKDFFQGKKILDLGGGVGHVADQFYKRGADVTVFEGREVHCRAGEELYPHLKFFKVNLEEDFSNITDQKFDVIVNWGVFYHLKASREFLKRSLEMTERLMLLDGDILLSEDATRLENPGEDDQGLVSEVQLLNAESVEKIIQKEGCSFTRITNLLDAVDSPVKYGFGGYHEGFGMKRAFWIVERP